jgi:hypothetical protein
MDVMGIQLKKIKSLIREAHLLHDISLIMENNFRLEKIEQMLNKRLPQDIQINEKQVEALVMADPTSKKEGGNVNAGKYAAWIAKQFLQAKNKKIFWEDLYKITNVLKNFHSLKARNKIESSKKDINNIKDYDELFDIISTEENEVVLSGFPDFRHLLPQHAELIYKEEGINAYGVKDYKAARELGSGSHWCTVPNKYACNNYLRQGNLYIIFAAEEDGDENVSIEKYQFHFPSHQYMDVNDRSIANNVGDLESLFPAGLFLAITRFAEKEGDIGTFIEINDDSGDVTIQEFLLRRPESFSKALNFMKHTRAIDDVGFGRKICEIARQNGQVEILAYYDQIDDVSKILQADVSQVNQISNDVILKISWLSPTIPEIQNRLKEMGLIYHSGDNGGSVLYRLRHITDVNGFFDLIGDSEFRMEYSLNIVGGEESFEVGDMNIEYDDMLGAPEVDTENLSKLIKFFSSDYVKDDFEDEEDYEHFLSLIKNGDMSVFWDSDYEDVEGVDAVKNALNSAAWHYEENAYQNMIVRKTLEFIEYNLGKLHFVNNGVAIELNVKNLIETMRDLEYRESAEYGGYDISDISFLLSYDRDNREKYFDPQNNGYASPDDEDYDEALFNEQLYDQLYESL